MGAEGNVSKEKTNFINQRWNSLWMQLPCKAHYPIWASWGSESYLRTQECNAPIERQPLRPLYQDKAIPVEEHANSREKSTAQEVNRRYTEGWECIPLQHYVTLIKDEYIKNCYKSHNVHYYLTRWTRERKWWKTFKAKHAKHGSFLLIPNNTHICDKSLDYFSFNGAAGVILQATPL